jgi:4-hydroxybenzoyl-CoA reductase subunit beta
MLTLPPFQYHSPKSVAEAVALLGAHGPKAKLIAGGTDLVPNMKHRLFTPEHVIGLHDIDELHRIGERDGALCLGAMVTLANLARDERVSVLFPSLAKAAAQVAGPQLREMGTLGGNLALDTRCVYYNQTHFWRKALGYCLKKDGTACHVVKGGQKCVAAASNDTAPVLITLGATVRLLSPRGQRELPLDQLYVADGVRNTVLEPDELITEVRVLLPQGRLVTGYQKLRIRASIDYPALTVAVAAWLERDGTAQWIRMVLSALGSRPHPVKRLEHLFGRALDAAAIEELGQAAFKQCHPLTNINVDPGWRRQMIPVFVRRAWAQALSVRS